MDLTTSPWAGLAPDVVREVANRLHDAGDFVRLHAVCKPWRCSRDTAPPLFRATKNQFLPWLLAAADEHSSTPLRFRCIFSKSSYRAPPPRPFVSRRNWVGSTGATAVRYLTLEHGHPSLHDPLTGEVTHVPHLPFRVDGHRRRRRQQDKHNPHGIVCGDDTILLYLISGIDDVGDTARYKAALLRPGDTRWTLVERTLLYDTPRRHRGICTAYSDNRIFILEDHHWRVVTPGVAVSGDVLVPMPVCNFPSHSNFVLESRGEILWVSVHAWVKYSYEYSYEQREERLSRTISVLVHTLEQDALGPTKMQWVRKNGHSLADRVLFLGSPNSLAIDASQLDGHGGCVYFVYYDHSKAMPGELFGVFRYNLVDGKTEFVERVPPGWDDKKCTWLVPQPSIAPIQNQKITKRQREATTEPKPKQLKTNLVTSATRISHISKHYEPCFTVMVRNLPPTVNSSELQLLFSRHGKVFSAEVLYKRTRQSEGIGLLTMSTKHSHPEDALDALKTVHLNGCRLEVSFVKKGRRSCLLSEHHNYM